jgi:hypothetical protein
MRLRAVCFAACGFESHQAHSGSVEELVDRPGSDPGALKKRVGSNPTWPTHRRVVERYTRPPQKRVAGRSWEFESPRADSRGRGHGDQAASKTAGQRSIRCYPAPMGDRLTARREFLALVMWVRFLLPQLSPEMQATRSGS